MNSVVFGIGFAVYLLFDVSVSPVLSHSFTLIDYINLDMAISVCVVEFIGTQRGSPVHEPYCRDQINGGQESLVFSQCPMTRVQMLSYR